MNNNNCYLLFLFLFYGLFFYTKPSFGFTSEVVCIEKERQALLKFKQGLVDDFDILSSWSNREDNKECCKWWGVKCSNRTGHVIVLDLSFANRKGHVGYLRGELSHSLTELQHLRYLDLSTNNINQYMFLGNMEVIGSLHRLKYLNLQNAGVSGVVPAQFGNLTELHTLNLGYNSLTIDNLEWLSHLRLLRKLDLSLVFLNTTDWAQVIFNLPFLEELYLKLCGLDNVIPSSLLLTNSSSETLSILDLSNNNLTSFSKNSWLFNVSKNLVTIDLSSNNLEGSIPDDFGKFISIENIDLTSNSLEGGIPKSFQNLSHLRSLNLMYNRLNESFPDLLQKLSMGANESLEILNLNGNRCHGPLKDLTRFSSLKILDLTSNFIEGTVSESQLSKLSNLKRLYLSFNPLTLKMSSDWVPSFQLEVIKLANCKMGPHFPKWISTQNNLSVLDLSSSGIVDTLPRGFWDISLRLSLLDLSNNQISGRFPERLQKFSFSNMVGLHLNKNKFEGSISFICLVSENIYLIDLSDNLFSGDLPNCWMNMKRLVLLNLGNNNFSGQIPTSLGLLHRLRALHLRNNDFTGEIPSSLKDCQELAVIDVQGNKLTGNIPPWIGTHLTSLAILILQSNQFDGNIPQDICHLSNIQIMDLSRNNINGTIPDCFHKLTSLVEGKAAFGDIIFLDFSGDMMAINYLGSVLVQWKGQKVEFKNGYMTIIDLSNNKLVGQIPQKFATLKGLHSLNLSVNYLTGNIIEHIGQMENLESLDLSRNQFSGEIPTSLALLHYLSVLNLSYNNLSGRIPSSTQLQSFNASSYIRNNGLCGLPLTQCPRDAFAPKSNDQEKKDDDANEDGFINRGFYMSIGIGFISGLWGVFVILLRASWRNAYFKFLENTYNWCYVILNVNMTRAARMLSG